MARRKRKRARTNGYILSNNCVFDEITRSVKVIAMWSGVRRNSPHSGAREELYLLKYRMKILKEIDQQIPMDVIFVNNINKRQEESLEYKEYVSYLNNLNGTKIKNGRVIVLHRKNIGFGFGAFNFAWQLFKENYEYFWFTEDDYINISEGVMSHGISLINQGAPYVCTSLHRAKTLPISFCRGGCLITKSAFLKETTKQEYGQIINYFKEYYETKKPLRGSLRRDFFVFPPENYTHQDIPFEKRLKGQKYYNNWLAELQLAPLIKHFNGGAEGTCLRNPYNKVVWWRLDKPHLQKEWDNNNCEQYGVFEGTERVPWDESMLIEDE